MAKKKSINGSYTTTCTSFLYKIVNTTIREEASKYFVSVLVKDIIKPLPITKTNVGIDLGVKYVLLKIKDMIESTTNKLSKYLTLPSLSEIVKN